MVGRLIALLLIGLLMPTYYGPQTWTAGTFAVTAPDAGDGNYPQTVYREKVFTTNSAGPGSERIIDTGDYGASAHDELITNFDARGALDGNGVYYEVDAKFTTAAQAALGNFTYPLNVGHTGSSSAQRYMQFRVALTEGKLYVWIKGDGESATSAVLTADNAWHRIKAQIVPSSDEGFTANGLVRVWLDGTLVFEDLTSFAYSTNATPFRLNYVYYGHYGLLPATNGKIYTSAPVVVTDNADVCCSDGPPAVVADGGGQGAGAEPVQTPTIGGAALGCAGGGTVPTQADVAPSETWWGT